MNDLQNLTRSKLQKGARNLKKQGSTEHYWIGVSLLEDDSQIWSDGLKTVASVDFDKVVDTAGQEQLTRNTLPVESATDVGPARRIERGGNAEVDRRQRTLLQPFVDTVYGENEGRRMTLAQISALLDRIPGFKAAQKLTRST